MIPQKVKDHIEEYISQEVYVQIAIIKGKEKVSTETAIDKYFNTLMQKASNDMIKLTSVIEDAEDIRGTLKQFMWSNCKACHSRYREEH